MRTLVFLEHHDGAIQKGSLGVLSKAASLGDAAGIVVGDGARDAAAEAGAHGAATVYVADAPELAAPLSQPRVDVLAKVARDEGFDAIFLGQSVLAADIAAALAVRLDAGLNWDLVDVRADDGSLVGVRPALGDSVYVDTGWRSTPAIALFRAGSFDPVPADRGGRSGGRVGRARELLDARHADRPRHGGAGRAVDRGRGHHRRRRPRPRRPRGVRAARGAREGARRRGRRDARRRRCGLVPVLDTGRPDGEDRGAEALHRRRDLRRDPAQGGHAELGHDRRRSTRTRMRRSSSSATSASSAT